MGVEGWMGGQEDRFREGGFVAEWMGAQINGS